MRKLRDHRKKRQLLAVLAVLAAVPSMQALAFGKNVDVAPHQTSYERERDAEQWARLRDNSIEWDELQDLVHEYNPTIQKLWISFRDGDKNGAYNIDYSRAQEQIDEAYDKAMSAADGNALSEALAQMQYDSSSARNTVDASAQSTNREAARLQMMQSELTTTETIRKSLIGRIRSSLQVQIDAENKLQQQANYDTAVRKQSVGQATDLEVLSAKAALDNAGLTETQDQDSYDKLTDLVKVDLGWVHNADPQFPEIPEISAEEISALDLSRDTEKALRNNYAIQINSHKQGVSSTETQIDTLANTLSHERENVSSDMMARYQAVLSKQSALTQAELAASNAQAELQKTERAYRLGSDSVRKLESARISANVAGLKLQQAKLKLTEVYYDYLAGVRGLATADQR